MTTKLDSAEANALIEVGKTVNAHLDLDLVLEAVMAVVTDLVKVEASSLVLVDDATDELVFHVVRGEKAGIVKPMRIGQGQGIVGSVIASGESAIVNDVATDLRFMGAIDKTSGFRTRSILCVPLVTPTRLWGAMEALNKLNGGDFDERDQQLCEAIAGQAAIAIENATLHKQVVASERMAAIGETIAGLAHCIKNVLNGVQGGSYMVDLGMRRSDNAMAAKGWRMVKKNNRFLHGLVLDMLTYSRERQPELEPSDVNQVVEQVCELVSAETGDGPTAVTWERNELLEDVVLDPKGIQRCLLNLVSNAVAACGDSPDGRVHVRSQVTDGEMFSIHVADNGSGISEENKEKLFEPFFSTKGSKGTGLGLAVTRKIITEHGGTISVESETGQGTTFTIALPLRRERDSC